MASISGLGNSNSLSSTSSLRGYGGLASGLDRDTLIEQLTYATRSKIAKQKQSKQSLTWQQEAIRSITDKTHVFTEKYTSYSSSSNLTSSNLFSRSQITAMGANSKMVGVSGKANTADVMSILGVKQMAKDAQIMGGVASSGTLTTGSVASVFGDKTVDANILEGQSFVVRQGSSSYLVTLGSGSEYTYEEPLSQKTIEAINKSFEQVKMSDNRKLSDMLEASIEVSADGKNKLKLTNKDAGDNDLTITSGMGNILQNLGFLNEGESLPEGGMVIHGGASETAKNETKVFEKTSYADYLAEKTMTFDYNGTSKTIELKSGLTSMEDVKKDLQEKLDSAFGSGRIKVGLDPGDTGTSKLTFKTTKPGGGANNEDKSSMLTITDADDGLLGKDGFFGIDTGQSNRINLTASILESGVNLAGSTIRPEDLTLTINGKPVTGVDLKTGSVADVMKAINENEELGVKVSYLSNSDRFVITSTEKGASGHVELGGTAAQLLFGSAAVGEGAKVQGQDAIISVKYPGDTNVTEITRDSNAFTVDGLNLTLKGTFGYTGDVYDSTTEAITFDAQVDAEGTSKVVKEMVEGFNEIIELINKEVGQKRNRDYAPLTDEQREGMSEDQIKAWEEKAKQGLLFNDSDLRSFADGLRFTIPASNRADLAAMGITISTDYNDKGKLVFNETKFKAALEADPDKVKNMFTQEQVLDADKNVVQAGGLMTQISSVITKYAGTTGSTKGALIERAGSIFAPTSISTNSIQKQMDEIDKVIKSLNTKLQTEQDRYIKQFTSMETLISQMNSQSSYLSQMSGGL